MLAAQIAALISAPFATQTGLRSTYLVLTSTAFMPPGPLHPDQILALAVWLAGRLHEEGLDAAERLSEILGIEGLLGFERER
mgnify:CR=1 FL=1